MMNNSKQESDTNSALHYARNEYYVGNYLASINQVLPTQGSADVELLSYMYLSYLANDSGSLLAKHISDSDTKNPLFALRMLYDAFEQPDKVDETLDKLLEIVATEEDETNIWHIAIAILYAYNHQYDNALKILHGSTNLESLALSIQCLLKLNRLDLAKQLLAKMQEISDDHTLTQLAQAWIALCSGNEQQLQDAFHIYQEFSEKFKASPLLLNGQAVVQLGLEQYDEAEAALREALSKKQTDYNTLINMMVWSHLSGKTTDIVNFYWEQLQQNYPKSEIVTKVVEKSAEFDRLCAQYMLNETTD